MSNIYSAKFNNSKLGELSAFLKSEGLSEDGVKSEYELVRMKADNLSAIFYISGKVVVQGKRVEVIELFRALNEGGTVSSIMPDSGVDSISDRKNSIGDSTIGADETGKGDYFGPLVAGAFFLNDKAKWYVEKYGITDSKKMNDSLITEVFWKMDADTDLYYEVGVLLPEKFNAEYSRVKNIGIVLAQLHAITIEKLVLKLNVAGVDYEKIIIDQFSPLKSRVLNELPKSIDKSSVHQMHKAERFPAVALASVIARAVFLIGMEKLSEKYQFKFPKGATHVIDAGKRFVRAEGEAELGKVAKLNFKTTGQILSK